MIFSFTSGPVATRWLQTICFINYFVFVMLVMLFVSTARLVARKARVQCTFVSDKSLSRDPTHTQGEGSNFTLSYKGLCNRHSMWLLFWRLGKHLLFIRL